jgi:hypothetical protein
VAPTGYGRPPAVSPPSGEYRNRNGLIAVVVVVGVLLLLACAGLIGYLLR